MWRRLVSWIKRERLESDLDDELRFHLEMRALDNMTSGMSDDEARHAARRAFGNLTLVREETRAMWGFTWLERLGQDVRYGLRVLTKSRGFTAVAVVALALGIGANTAIFSVVNTVLLRPLPYRDPDRLVWITQFIPTQGNTLVFDSDYFAWLRQNQVFDGMAAYRRPDFTLTGAGDPERLEAARVTASFFPLLGVAPMLGRSFLVEEDRPGCPPVCVLSHELWQRHFAADPSMVGRSITLDGQPYTVLGVMPPRFEFVSNFKPALYVPFDLRETAGVAPGELHMFPWVIARLKPGITIERAQSDLAVIGRGLQAGYKGGYARMMAGARPQVMSLHLRQVGNVRPALLILLGAVGFVLLIVCANVANLQLARAVTRRREMAIRTALGAGHWRLARQLFTECLLLAVFGGAAGVALAAWGVSALRTLGPADIPHLADVRLDYRVLLFTALVAIATGMIFGLVPVVNAAKTDPNESLKEGGSRLGSGRSGQLLRGGLTIAELALALVLLTGSGLLIRSFVRLTTIDPGFDAHHVLTARIGLPENQYLNPEQQRTFFQSLLERLRALPGVSSADAVVAPPLMGSMMAAGFDIEGLRRPEVNTVAQINIAGPAYFQTMGIPLISGRPFTAQDNADAPKVVILNQACVRRFFPDASPIGKRIQIAGTKEWATIVGVIGDVRQAGLVSLPEPEIIEPFMQAPYSDMAVVLRTAADPLSLVPALRSQVRSLDRALPVFEVSTMEQYLGEEVAGRRFNMLLLGLFAGLALVLAVVGIYGVAAYSAAQRTHEVGIRIALGASARDVLRLTLGRSLMLTLAGLAIGLAGALALTRFLSSLLYGVGPTDLPTFIAVSVLLAAAALAASYIPARRATRVDPLVALRYE
jgi:predicted permease